MVTRGAPCYAGQFRGPQGGKQEASTVLSFVGTARLLGVAVQCMLLFSAKAAPLTEPHSLADLGGTCPV